MADPVPAITLVLQHEGGSSDDPNDSGGKTKFGISQKSYPSLDIRNLTEAQARQIYLDDFWVPYHFGLINSQVIANKVFDLAVNIGPVQAIRKLQQSVSYFISGPLVADGKIGVATVDAIDAVDEKKLLREFQARAIHYHASLGLPNYLLGWIRRDLDT